MTQATKSRIPTTLPEVLKAEPEALAALTLAELAEVHNVATTGSTKAAKLKAAMIADIIAGKKKEAAKAQAAEAKKEPEVVANSAKPTAAPKKSQTKRLTGAAAKAAQAKAEREKTQAAKPAAKPQAKPEPKPQAAASAKPEPKQDKRPEDMTPEELIAYVKSLEAKAERFPQTFETERSTFRKITPGDVQELGAELIANPYSVYMLIDERLDDSLTQALVVYASDKLILAIDKNRKKETFFHIQSPVSTLKESAWTIKEQGTTFTFPIALYVREPKA